MKKVRECFPTKVATYVTHGGERSGAAQALCAKRPALPQVRAREIVQKD
jgi:hypothetical protein